MNPKYPVYIISKGRWKSRLTAKALDKMEVPYHIIIEPQEYNEYAAVINPTKILQLPFSNLGQGSIPARNWVWEHALNRGALRHWILDDNIAWFARIWGRKKIKMGDGTCFPVVEDFVDRYENVPMAGMQYEMFTPSIYKHKPFLLNTRIYSCILLSNKTSLRWRGHYNEDTDLSLRFLKGGLCTILVQAFVCKKIATMTMKGGNTEDLYKLSSKDGRLEMARSLQRQHPDVVKITRRWGRWQHQVDYSHFKKNRLILKKDVIISNTVNNYGLELRNILP